MKLSLTLDERNANFSDPIKDQLSDLSRIDTDALEWLVVEHYQFSVANVGLLTSARNSTSELSEKGVAKELQRNIDEEDGHAPMYKQGMGEIGTDMEDRDDFAPTTRFLASVEALCTMNPSRALGTVYATETAAIFEHETFFDICKEIAERRGYTYENSTIKRFHDIHLDEGVEQGHKDGLAAFVDLDQGGLASVDAPIVADDVRAGGLNAIAVMEEWWGSLLSQIQVQAGQA